MTDKKTSKVSIYLKDTELRRDIELLAEYDGVSLTEIFTRALQAYVAGRTEDIDFMRGQVQERLNRRQNERCISTC